MMIFTDGMYLQILFTYLPLSHKEWIPSSMNQVITHNWMPKPHHCNPSHILLNQFQLYIVIWIVKMRTDSINDPNLVDQAENGQLQISSTIWDHNILIYCILNAKFNIILLYWHKQHLESGIIKWGCRPLNEKFHLVLMFTSFRSVQTCIGLNIELSGLHVEKKITRTCLRSRHPHAEERQTHTKVF